jgi:hypothetical protein
MLIVGVVPVMEGRSGNQYAQPAKPPAQVGMDKKAPHGAHQQDEQRDQVRAIAFGIQLNHGWYFQ